QSAVANAENNHNLNVDQLVVAEAYVGKSVKMKRFNARARGRAAPIEKHFSRLTIVVREGEVQAKAKKAAPAPKKAAAAKTEDKAAAKKPAAKKTAAKKTAAKKTASTKQDKE